MQKIELTDKDTLDLGDKSFKDMVIEAVKRAFSEGIKANSIVINKKFVRVKKAWINTGFSCSELPDMFCGLEVYLTDSDIPENYSFAVLERDKTERELLIERTTSETVKKFAKKLKSKIDKKSCCGWVDELPISFWNGLINETCKEITDETRCVRTDT